MGSVALARLLIANRGEIAVRIARAAAELEIPAVGVFSEDDAASLHAQTRPEALALPWRDGKRLLASERADRATRV